jgi:hypothetical protein
VPVLGATVVLNPSKYGSFGKYAAAVVANRRSPVFPTLRTPDCARNEDSTLATCAAGTESTWTVVPAFAKSKLETLRAPRLASRVAIELAMRVAVERSYVTAINPEVAAACAAWREAMRRTDSLDDRPLPTATELAPSLVGHVKAVALLLDVAGAVVAGVIGELEPPPPPPHPARAIETAANAPASGRKKLRRTCLSKTYLHYVEFLRYLCGLRLNRAQNC